jgi:hypothetical protein
VIEQKVRRAAETNEAFVRVRDLFVEVKYAQPYKDERRNFLSFS